MQPDEYDWTIHPVVRSFCQITMTTCYQSYQATSTLLHTFRILSLITSKCSSPIPPSIVWPVSESNVMLRLGSSRTRQSSAWSRAFWWASDGGSMEQKKTGSGISIPARTGSSSRSLLPSAELFWYDLAALIALFWLLTRVSPVDVCFNIKHIRIIIDLLTDRLQYIKQYIK